jgi:hypothetical protein
MNKATIYDWTQAASQQLKEIGYENKQEINPDDVFKIASDIFGAGLNVMVFHNEDNIVLAVDTKRFQQR